MPDAGTSGPIDSSAQASERRLKLAILRRIRNSEFLSLRAERELNLGGDPEILTALLANGVLPRRHAIMIAHYAVVYHLLKRGKNHRCWWHEVLQAAASRPWMPFTVEQELHLIGEWYICRNLVENPTSSLRILQLLAASEDAGIRTRARERLKFHGIQLPVPDVPVIRIGAA